MSRREMQLILAFAGPGTALIACLLMLGIGGSSVPQALAAGCNVPGDKATIQAAINDPTCNPIFVSAGTYVENLTINRALTLHGADRDTTIIDGNHSDVVIKITNGAVPTIQGFTIRNGDGSTNGGQGGGIHIDHASAVIQNNIIADNAASTISDTAGLGAGISVVTSTSPMLIYNNIIRNNVAFSSTQFSTDTVYGVGGGIGIMGGGSAVVSGNQILDNAAALLLGNQGHGGGYGGGLFAMSDHLTIHNNTIQGNRGIVIQGQGGGGGISLWTMEAVTITENAILQNTGSISSVSGAGGGLWSVGVQQLRIVGNDIMSNTGAGTINTTANTWVTGGGVMVDDWWSTSSDTALVENNRIIGNITVQTMTVSGAGLDGGASGGGLFVGRMDTTTVISNEVANNVCARSLSLIGGANGNASGGGIDVSENGLTFLQGNVIRGNTANLAWGVTPDGAGGGMNVYRSTVDSQRNLYLSNRMNPNGGGGASGAWVWDSVLTSTNDIFAHNRSGIGGGNNSTITLINDTLYDNRGQGAYVQEGSTMLVSNTIVVGHDNGLEIGPQAPASTLIESYNLLSNTTNYNGAVTKHGNTILNQDPLFVDAAADDFHLLLNSPAVNKGDDSVAPATDFEGNSRPQGPQVDIGAYEYRYSGLHLPVIMRTS